MVYPYKAAFIFLLILAAVWMNFYRRKRNDKVKIQKSHVAFLGDPYVCDHFCQIIFIMYINVGKMGK